MQTTWLKRENNPDLLLFILGWASGPQSVPLLSMEPYDQLCLYDYRTIETEGIAGLLKPYRSVTLVAWSFGVWVTEYLWKSLNAGGNIRTTLAVNGTPLPIDERFGIPPKAFTVTLRSIRHSGLDKFYERMYAEKRDVYPSCERSVDSLAEELHHLGEMFRQFPAAESVPWQKALIGGNDRIFPPENMARYWDKKGIFATVIASLPHYPFSRDASEKIRELLHDTF